MQEPPAFLLHKLVFELDKAADKILRQQLGISYKRALFLLVLHRYGTLTQHQLAIKLGYSDPAVSAMLLELTKCNYVTVAVSPEHKRKRLVSLTQIGTKIVHEGIAILNKQFDELVATTAIDTSLYNELTSRLYEALAIKEKE